MKGRASAAFFLLLPALALASVPAVAQNTDDGPGFPQDIDDWEGSAAIGDLDGDGSPEIVAGAFAFHADGSRVAGFPVAIPGTGSTSPALADLDGDGADEVIYACTDSRLSDSGVYVFDGRGATWPGFPRLGVIDSRSSPAVDDVDGDGVKDIVIGATLPVSGVYAYSSLGGDLLPGFPVATGAWVYATPALGDFDGDGVADIMIGSRYPAGRIFAIRGDGSHLAGWPKTITSGIEAPATLVDVDRDGRMEAFVPSTGGWIFGLDGEASALPGFPVYVGGAFRTAAAAGDVGADGITDLVVRAENGTVAVLTVAGEMRSGYPRKLFNNGSPAVVLGDVTGDGRVEVVGLGSTHDSRIYAYDVETRAAASGYPIRIAGAGDAILPALVDLDGDRRLELVVASGELEVIATPAEYVADAVFWPALGGTYDRVSRYVDPRTRPFSVEVTFVPERINVAVRRRGFTVSLEFDTTAVIAQLDPGSIAITSVDGAPIAPVRWDMTSRPSKHDIDGDGVKELYLKFAPDTLTRVLPPMTSMTLGQSTTFTLGVTGRRVDARPFAGTGTLTLFR